MKEAWSHMGGLAGRNVVRHVVRHVVRYVVRPVVRPVAGVVGGRVGKLSIGNTHVAVDIDMCTRNLHKYVLSMTENSTVSSPV